MGRDISIAISARDNFSQNINTMKNSNTAFRKDLQETQIQLEKLTAQKKALQIDTKSAQKELENARQQFLKTGSAADEMKMKMAAANYDSLKSELKSVSGDARQAERDLSSMSGVMSKAQNRASAGSGGISGMMKTLAGAGLKNMIGQSLSGALSEGISSAFGNTAGGAINSLLSSTVAGAAIGSVIPGIGTAIGAGVGALAGGVTAAVQVGKAQDDAYKSVKQSQYEKQTSGIQADIQSGSSIAAGRETSLISFTTLFGGDKEKAAGFLEQLKNMANTTPFLYGDLASMSKVMKTYGFRDDKILGEITKIGDAGAALGMSTQSMTDVATYLGRIKSTGKTSLEYLNPLLERGLPIWKYLADTFGKSETEVQELASQNKLDANSAAQGILDRMGKEFSGSMEQQSHTYSGLESTLQGMNEEMQNASGEGYTEEKKIGMQKQIDFLSGDGGKKMEDANKMIGKYYASLENLKDQYSRETLDAVMGTGKASGIFTEEGKKRLGELQGEYQKAVASENGAEAGKILAEAKSLAEMEYNSSTGAQNELNSQIDLAKRIGSDESLNSAYYDSGKRLGDELGKGMMESTWETVRAGLMVTAKQSISAISSGEIGAAGVSAVVKATGSAPGYVTSDAKTIPGYTRYGQGNAWGLNYVPYDDFPALLHQGEKVLTASEARMQGSGGVSVNVSGNQITVRSDGDIDAIARKIASEVAAARRIT